MNTKLAYGTKASEKKKKGVKHTENLSNVLFNLADEGVLMNPFGKTLTKGMLEAHLLRHCLDLIDYISCKDEKKALLDDKQEETD